VLPRVSYEVAALWERLAAHDTLVRLLACSKQSSVLTLFYAVYGWITIHWLKITEQNQVLCVRFSKTFTARVAIRCRFLNACQTKSFCVRTLNFRTLHPGWPFFQTSPAAWA
jgi:hypothetical protein